MQAELSTTAQIVRGSRKRKATARKRLFDRMEGALANRQKFITVRINWDVEPNKSLRERLYKSWTEQTDKWRAGEKFGRFCERTGISRHVLRNYIHKKQSGEKPKKRGRKPALEESVMRHLCEGTCFAFYFVFFAFRLFTASPHFT